MKSDTKTIKSSFNNLILRFKRYKVSFAFIAPFSIIFITFTTIPVLIAIYLSFTSFNILQPPIFIGLENYRRLFIDDEIFLIAIQNTVVFASVTGPVGYLLCLSIAWLVNELKAKTRSVLTLLFYAPTLASGVTIFQFIFSGDRFGLLNAYMIELGIISDPIQWLFDPRYMKGVIILVVLWASLGTTFLTFIAGFQTNDKSLFEAGAVDGIRNRYQELWYITLPQMKPQLMFGAVMSITSSFGIGIIITQLMGFPSSNYAAHTIMNHLEDFGSIRFEMGYACAISTLLFIFMVGLNKAIQKLLSKIGS